MNKDVTEMARNLLGQDRFEDGLSQVPDDSLQGQLNQVYAPEVQDRVSDPTQKHKNNSVLEFLWRAACDYIVQRTRHEERYT